MFRVHIIGLNIICLCHISYSFVLLTANVDDVKKLARKFVSESLAEQITGFIAQVTEHVINVTAENNMDAGDDGEFDNEETDKLYSVSRQRFDKVPDRSHKNYHRTENVVDNKMKDVEDGLDAVISRDKTKKSFSKSKLNNWAKDKAAVTKNGFEDGKIKKNQVQSNHLAKQYSYALNVPRMPGPSLMGDKPRQIQDVQKPHHSSTYRPKIEYTLGYAEKFLLDENHSSDQDPKKSKSFDMNLHSQASENNGDFEETNKESNKTINIIDMFQSKFNELVNVQRATNLTTKKEKIEFDQYDNFNYPKRNFVATSGPVALPKLPVEKPEKPWWDRSMPQEPHKKNKVWF